MPGVACVQAGGEAGEDDEEDAGTTGVACAQAGEPQVKRGKNGKPIKCWNCGKNHTVHNCPELTGPEKEEFIRKKHEEFREEKAARAAAKASGDTVAGQAHAQVEVEEVEDREWHQDDEEDGFVCVLQGEDELQDLGRKQVVRETLKSNYFYLDSMSSFNQMFERNYLGTVNKVGVTLRGKCNAGVVSSNEKGYLMDMFSMWLV